MSRFYVTTPIYYINAEPHLGHAYTTLVADAAARAHRLAGNDVFFLTGTDEHGQKVERAAQKAGVGTPAFADRVAQRFRDLLPVINASNDDFIRTTEPRHRAAAQALWRRVRDRGFIYKGKYEGWYCTVDEVFVPDTQLQDGRCAICGNLVERLVEESYFFKLAAFQEPLLQYYREHPEFVAPETRFNEVIAFVETGLQDLSVSRTSFKWGIPVPDDPAHVMYVWFDALTNYMTAVGYGQDDAASAERFERYWPADVHLIGKEIVRQHAVYWPAFLMAAGLPLPKQIVSHGWWLMDGAKMSKSVGNVVQPSVYIEKFGLDALRYFVFREMVLGQDASFGDEAFLTRYNSDLANDLGNLVSRVVTMVHRYFDGTMPAGDVTLMSRTEELALRNQTHRLIDSVRSAIGTIQFSVALREIWDAIGAMNRYLVTRQPWILAKDASKRNDLGTVLYATADSVRVCAELLRPFMPGTAERTLRMLGVEPEPQSWVTLRPGTLEPGTRLGRIEQLFPRIEQSVEELRDMTNDPSSPAPPQSGNPAPTNLRTEAPKNPTSTDAPTDLRTEAPKHPAAEAPKHPGTEAPKHLDAAPVAPRIAIDDFMKVELRVAKVLAAERVPKSKKLIKLHVDVGSEQRTLVAGIADAYEPEALVGRSVVIVFNLQPATLMGIESNGMVLAASPEGGKPMLLSFETPPPPGTRVR